jgi:aspartyl-tRNA(Asn)/glutamyl-tRNA(Gln) amidotransferase subunit A
MNLHRLPIAELVRRDPVAVVDHFLARIAAHDGRLGAFTHVDAAGARAAAAAAPDGPLRGVPVAIKANIDVAGWPTTAGVGSRAGAIAAGDAPAVARLRAAGAIIIGQANMHECALGAVTDNHWHGRTHNPHAHGFTAGGSSGGSAAAVAAGLVSVALGTDTLGSIRIPAAYCGIFGLKPGWRVVPDAGVVPLCARLDAVGPLARSVADLAAVQAVLAPMAAAQPVRRVALLEAVSGHAEAQPAVSSALAAAVAALPGLGVATVALAAPFDPLAARTAAFIEMAREAGSTFAADRAAGGISPMMERLLQMGEAATPAEIAAGEGAMAAAVAAVRDALDAADVILLPTTPQPAFPFGRAEASQGHYTGLANMAGLPAISVPAGWTADGLPVGVQMIGWPGSEATLLDFGGRLAAALGAYRAPSGWD